MDKDDDADSDRNKDRDRGCTMRELGIPVTMSRDSKRRLLPRQSQDTV